MPDYTRPDTEQLTEDHVREALDFLVAIEPIPTSETREDYEAALAPYRSQVTAAIASMRQFAEQTEPLTLERMQRDYHGFVNDPRYRTSPEVSSVVSGALNEAWNGVGPWRR